MMQLLPNMICTILDGIGELRIARILRGLAIESDVTIAPENTLIILDEIQEVPAALQSLKYFSEDDRHSYYILEAVLASCERMEVPRCNARSSITAMWLHTSLTLGAVPRSMLPRQHAREKVWST